MKSLPRRRWPLVLLLVLVCAPAGAAFNAGVAPPRFELRANPGETVRDVVTLFNASGSVESYLLRTADWDLQQGGGVTIHPPQLQPGSCRPWTRIERSKVTLAPQGTKRYRFEISVPDDAPPGECRVALLVEAAPAQLTPDGADPGFSVRLPIAARLAVIIYVVVGDAQPDLEVEGARMSEQRGRAVPVLSVRNDGGAHGRPAGFFKAEDASGQSFDLVVVPFPVLPGQRGDITLQPDPALYGDEPLPWQLPLRLRGTLETGSGDKSVDLLAR